MFRKAQVKLTIFYSLVFLFFFWLSNIVLYFLMSQSLGGDPALIKLQDTLLLLNIILVFLVPFFAWFFTLLTLKPVQEIHERQKQFVSNVSHELRTPLSILNGEMEIALKKNRQASFYKQVITSSKQEVDRLTTLVENLLFLAREDQGRQDVKFEKVDITDLIGSVIVSLKAKISDKRISLLFEPPKESVAVWGQTTMLQQLFFNIIDNAILYTPATGNIWISISTNKHRAQIKVKDNGIGISSENQVRIFERFYRVDTARSQTKGNGLGLAICRSIVDLHHGWIKVHSLLGKGATFHITLPIANS